MMLTILEKYFLEHGQLVLPGIGHLRMNQIDAVQLNGQFQPPVHQIVFDAIIEPTTKPNKLFYIYLSDYLLYSLNCIYVISLNITWKIFKTRDSYSNQH